MADYTIVMESEAERAPVAAGVTVKFRLDVHAGQITVCRQLEGRLPPPQK